ncbi:MAG: GntR family transcriptional regulator [Deltaproteobacteria bacterium]|nr:GntR family transcriptional regulator [Deltaproteobacteria bacterium]
MAEGAGRSADRLVRPNASEAVAAHVRRLVFDGELRPGEKVPQQQIADALGVSRIPVREALAGLAREGVVRIEPHRGAYVNAFDSAAIEDHYELYGLIYGQAIRRAVERAGGEALTELAGLAASIEAAEDAALLCDRVTRFHARLQEVGGSPRLRELVRALSGLVPGNFFAVIPGSSGIAREGFLEIAKAMRAGEAEEAARRCLAMHSALGQRVVAHLEARGLFAPEAS